MSAILLVAGEGGAQPEEATIQRMLTAMAHRGAEVRRAAHLVVAQRDQPAGEVIPRAIYFPEGDSGREDDARLLSSAGRYGPSVHV
jgi:hypothetical protein